MSVCRAMSAYSVGTGRGVRGAPLQSRAASGPSLPHHPWTLGAAAWWRCRRLRWQWERWAARVPGAGTEGAQRIGSGGGALGEQEEEEEEEEEQALAVASMFS